MQFARPRIGRRRRARGNYNARTPVINYRDTRLLMDHRGGSAWRERARSEGNRDVSARRAGQLRRYPRELIGTIKGRGKRGAQPRFRARRCPEAARDKSAAAAAADFPRRARRCRGVIRRDAVVSPSRIDNRCISCARLVSRAIRFAARRASVVSAAL